MLMRLLLLLLWGARLRCPQRPRLLVAVVAVAVVAALAVLGARPFGPVCQRGPRRAAGAASGRAGGGGRARTRARGRSLGCKFLQSEFSRLHGHKGNSPNEVNKIKLKLELIKLRKIDCGEGRQLPSSFRRVRGVRPAVTGLP